MPHGERLVAALEFTREAEIRLHEASITKYPASLAAREHLVAVGSEIVSVLKAGRPHVPQAMNRTQSQMAHDLRFLITTLLDRFKEPRLLVERSNEREDPLPRFRNVDVDRLLKTAGQLRRWATGVEIGVRTLRQRMEESDRRSN
jgi:hypothetical protein